MPTAHRGSGWLAGSACLAAAGSWLADLRPRPTAQRPGGRELLEQAGNCLHLISPNPAKHAVTPEVDNKARGIVKWQTYCKLKLVIFDPNYRDRLGCILMQCEFTRGCKSQIDEKCR
jgi:hypothetical protein